jgi:hypothetical protein
MCGMEIYINFLPKLENVSKNALQKVNKGGSKG